MTTVFQDLGLTQGQINANYSFKQIQIADEHGSSNVFVDVATDNLVVANVDNTYDNATEVDLVLVGTGLTNTFSDSVVNIGHNTIINAADAVVNIGGAAPAGADNTISEADNVVNIGHSNVILESNNVVQIGGSSTVGAVDPFIADNSIVVGFGNLCGTEVDSFDNVCIGNITAPPSGSNNIVMGQSPAYHDQTATVHSDNIIIAHKPLTNTLVGDAQSGSVIIGGGAVPSILPKLQFLSPDMIPLLDGAGTAVYVGGAAVNWNPVDVKGWVRMKYQGVNIRVPFVLDDDAVHA